VVIFITIINPLVSVVPVKALGFDQNSRDGPTLITPFSSAKLNSSEDFQALFDEDEEIPEYVGSALWSGMVDVEIVDMLIFCAMVNGLRVLNISDSSAPVFVSELLLPEGRVTDIKVKGDSVFLTQEGGNVFYIVDVADPAFPDSVRYSAPGPTYGIDVVDSVAFVAYGDYYADNMGFCAINLRNSKVLADNSLDYIPTKVEVRGNYAYVLGGYKLKIFDISDVTKLRDVREYWTGYNPVDFEVNDTLMFLADLDQVWPANYSAFTILRISDPENPVMTEQVRMPGCVTGVTLVDSLVYVANGVFGVRIFDPFNPDSAILLGTYPVHGFAAKVKVKDGLAFVVDYGPQSADVTSYLSSDPTRPGDLQVVSVADPTLPELVSTYPLPGSVTGVADGSYADRVFALNNTQVGIDVWCVDVSDNSKPRVVGTYSTSGSAENAVVVDTMLFLAAGSEGIEIVNIADLENPALIGHYTSSVVLDLLVNGTIVYAVTPYGVDVVDVSDLENPAQLGVFDGSLAIEVAIHGNCLFVANRLAGMMNLPRISGHIEKIELTSIRRCVNVERASSV